MIGHSYRTLEELPYILITLDNRTISCLGFGLLKGLGKKIRIQSCEEMFLLYVLGSLSG